METKPPVPRAILVGIQVPSVDDVAHAASIEELGHLVKTLGYEIVGTMSQKRDAIDGGTVLGKGRLAELAAITGGTGVVGSMAVLQKSKARERIDLLTVRFMPSYSRTALDIPDEISRSGKNLHRSGSDQSESLVVISRCAQAAARLVPPREIHGVRPDRGDGGRPRDEAAQQDTGRAGLFREPRMVIKWVGAPLNLPANLKPQRCRLHAVP